MYWFLYPFLVCYCISLFVYCVNCLFVAFVYFSLPRIMSLGSLRICFCTWQSKLRILIWHAAKFVHFAQRFLVLLKDLSFPCGNFFPTTMGISMGKWQKSLFKVRFGFLMCLHGGFGTPQMPKMTKFQPFWGYQKRHFGCPNQNSKTTFIDLNHPQITP